MKPNQKLFDVSAASILARLYDDHPNPVILRANDLFSEIEQMSDIELELKKERDVRTIANTINWLWREKFIHCVGTRMPSPDGSRNGGQEYALGHKGLMALRAMPEALEVDQTLGEKLVNELRQGGIGAALGVLPTILGAG